MDQRKKTYLLTGGLVPLLENRYKVLLTGPVRAQIRGLEEEYAGEIRTLLEGRSDRDSSGDFLWNVSFVNDCQIDTELRTRVVGARSQRPLVSFDDVYCQDLADAHYSITRLADPSDLGGESVPGPRLGFNSLERQVIELKRKLGSEIDIMDIGTFGGGTISEEITGRLKANGITVGNVFLVFASQEGIDKIHATGSRLRCSRIYDWIDWLEMRDCLGFDGRKVVHTPSTKYIKNAFVRYCDKASDWASIPPQVEDRFKQLYDQYFQKMQQVLAEGANVKVRLDRSPNNPLVYELGVGK